MREVPSSFIRMFCHATKFKKHHYILLLRKFLVMRCFLRQGLDQIEEKLWHDQARTFKKLDGTLKLSNLKQERLKNPSSFTEIQYFLMKYENNYLPVYRSTCVYKAIDVLIIRVLPTAYYLKNKFMECSVHFFRGPCIRQDGFVLISLGNRLP